MDEIQDTRLREEPEIEANPLYMECKDCIYDGDDWDWDICPGCMRHHMWSACLDLYTIACAYGTTKILPRSK